MKASFALLRQGRGKSCPRVPTPRSLRPPGAGTRAPGLEVLQPAYLLRLQGRPVVGADAHLYQGALGASLRFPGGLDLLIEAAPMGERAFTSGVQF